MSELLELEVGFDDKLSAGSKKAADSLAKLDRQIEQVEAEIKRLNNTPVDIPVAKSGFEQRLALKRQQLRAPGAADVAAQRALPDLSVATAGARSGVEERLLALRSQSAMPGAVAGQAPLDLSRIKSTAERDAARVAEQQLARMTARPAFQRPIKDPAEESAFQRRLNESRKAARELAASLAPKVPAGPSFADRLTSVRGGSSTALSGLLRGRAESAAQASRESMLASMTAKGSGGGWGASRWSQAVAGANSLRTSLGQLQLPPSLQSGISGLAAGFGIVKTAGLAAFAALGTVATATFGGIAAVSKKAFDAQLLRERYQISLGAITKTDGPAMFERLKAMSLEFGGDLNNTLESYQSLMVSGFSQDTADQVYKMSQDMMAIGKSAENVKLGLLGISQIQSKGVFQLEEARQINENLNISTDRIFQKLAENAGKTKQEMMELQLAGKVTGEEAVKAIIQAAGEISGSKAPGDFAKRMMGETLAGTLASLRGSIGAVWDDIGKRAQPLYAVVKEIATEIAGWRNQGADTTFSLIADTIARVADGIRAAWRMAKVFGQAAQDAFSAVFSRGQPTVLDQLSSPELMQSVTTLGTMVGELVAELVSPQGMDGLIQGITTAGQGFTAMARAALGVMEAVRGIINTVDLLLTPLQFAMNLISGMGISASALDTGSARATLAGMQSSARGEGYLSGVGKWFGFGSDTKETMASQYAGNAVAIDRAYGQRQAANAATYWDRMGSTASTATQDSWAGQWQRQPGASAPMGTTTNTVTNNLPMTVNITGAPEDQRIVSLVQQTVRKQLAAAAP